MSNSSIVQKNRVRVTGNPEAARTLILVHGLGTNQTVWSAVAASFERDFRIVLMDHAGSNDSSGFDQADYLDLHGYARDLLAVCRALDLRDAVAVGHSVGAMIVLLASLAQPGHFSKLVLLGGSPRYLDEPGYRGGFTKADLDQTYSVVMSDQKSWAQGFAAAAVGSSAPARLAMHLAESLQQIPQKHLLTVLCAIFQSDHRADLARVSHPTLIIQSREDAIVPLPVAQFMHDHIRGSQLRVIEAKGHLPHLSAPGHVVDAMWDFVST